MLRALGIAFIVCSIIFCGLLVIGLGWWAIASGTVQIAGFNQQQQNAEDSHSQIPAHSRAGVGLDVPADAAFDGSPRDTVSRKTAARQASFGVALSSTALYIGENELRNVVSRLEVTRVTVERATNHITWAPQSQPIGIPEDGKKIHVYLRTRDSTAIPDDVLTAIREEITTPALHQIEIPGSGATDTTAGRVSGTEIKLSYPLPAAGIESTLGIQPEENVKGDGTLTVIVAGRIGAATPPTFMNFYNGDAQPDDQPLDQTGTSTVTVYDDYLRFTLTSSYQASQISAYLMVKTGDKEEQQTEPVRRIRSAVAGTERRNVFTVKLDGDAPQFQLKPRQTALLFLEARDSNGVALSQIQTITKADWTPASVTSKIIQQKLVTAPSQSTDFDAARLSVRPEFDLQFKLNSAVDDLDAIIRTSGGSITQRLTIKDGKPHPGASDSLTFTIPITNLAPGEQDLSIQLRRGTSDVGSVIRQPLNVLNSGPTIAQVNASAFTNSPQNNLIVVHFSKSNPITKTTAEDEDNYFVKSADGSTTKKPDEADLNEADNAVTLKFPQQLNPGQWKFVVRAKTTVDGNELGIQDSAGNYLNQDESNLNGRPFEMQLTRSGLSDAPLSQRGIGSASTGKHVEFQEYTEPREYPSGFNPSDKVVTRVARLYYFRDAHRVTQIVNRQAKSYNRQAVDMKQQFADAARHDFNQASTARQQAERKAIRAAQTARAAEEALKQHQQALIQARDRLGRLDQQIDVIDGMIMELEKDVIAASKEDPTTQGEDTDAAQADPSLAGDEKLTAEQRLHRMKSTRQALENQRNQARLDVDQEENSVNMLLSTVQAERTAEIRETERWESLEEEERLKAIEQFQREVAAKTEDPDTYVPGDPNSDDPVTQVSLSVVGEGLIQMRGPRKGVNEVHKMINQIDAPVGQVKVALHTVQVNGEGGDRMEQVVMRIQRYLDHSRFLTIQSGQMLRNAVVHVASQRASMVADTCPPGTPQELRDYKYQEAFFGQDFMQELKSMDSEFLRTGNKVLSLHSMDTTSLSSALFLLSLAKNDVREEILARFIADVQCKLPQDELNFFTESGAEYKFRHKEFKFLGQNAQFVALQGFFDAQVTGPDTLNPMQREFVRLAQIFKARLITEIELRQRVMERALIEERTGTGKDYQQHLLAAKAADEAAQKLVQTLRNNMREQLAGILEVVEQISLVVRNYENTQQINSDRQALIDAPLRQLDALTQTGVDRTLRPDAIDLQTSLFVRPNLNPDKPKSGMATKPLNDRIAIYQERMNFWAQWNARDPEVEEEWKAILNEFEDSLAESEVVRRGDLTEGFKSLGAQLTSLTSTYNLGQPYAEYAVIAGGLIVDQKSDETRGSLMIQIDRLNRVSLYVTAIQASVAEKSEVALSQLRDISEGLQRAVRTRDGIERVAQLVAAWESLNGRFAEFVRPQTDLDKHLQNANSGFVCLKVEGTRLQGAVVQAQEMRRPLDHKKFLDMLVDDVEEKFIELVEGTRAQTSNIDNYLKRLGTALEDDFNAQFYHPAFRYVRETSYFYDVSVGQVETTSIVANNRMFAKVEPQATMEFDLPKRDILINEAMNSALAAYNDYGALMADPNFLSLMSMYGGQPASQTYGQQFGAPYVQEVLPGLPATTDAQFLTSAKNNVPRLGSSLEALIPDPAIYKFQTGTGFEIRPVIQPDGQSVVFHLNYMYSTNVREPVRADEKHLGRVKRHFIDTDVVTGNYELREVSTYRVGLKASRTSRGVPLLEDIPAVGVLFRPQASAESSLQQNIILTQSVIYPTLFDLMGLRWAPAVADLDSLTLQEREFVTRNREKFLQNEVFDYSSLQVDEFMRIPDGERRGDLYRTQETIPRQHPNGYDGPGLNIRHGHLQEGYQPEQFYPQSKFIPRRSEDAPEFQEEPPRQPVYHAPGQLLLPQPVPPDPACLEGAMSVNPRDHQSRAAMLMPEPAEEPMTPMSHWSDLDTKPDVVPAQLVSEPATPEDTGWMTPIEFGSSAPGNRSPAPNQSTRPSAQSPDKPQSAAATPQAAGQRRVFRRRPKKKRTAVSRLVNGLFNR